MSNVIYEDDNVTISPIENDTHVLIHDKRNEENYYSVEVWAGVNTNYSTPYYDYCVFIHSRDCYVAFEVVKLFNEGG